MPDVKTRVSEDAVSAYHLVNKKKGSEGKLKFIILKLSDDFTQIVVEHKSTSEDYEEFRELLVNATATNKFGSVVKSPRYAIYDFEYDVADRSVPENKVTFIGWSPDDADVRVKFNYATAKELLKKSFNFIAADVQANDADDLEWDTIVKTVSKGLAI
ncbi:putative cofilin [Mariannaea sp. PMI_226]|nr:putative cofilin [Mariannaea sp. PMI_226]